jgi:hypothetical protein
MQHFVAARQHFAIVDLSEKATSHFGTNVEVVLRRMNRVLNVTLASALTVSMIGCGEEQDLTTASTSSAVSTFTLSDPTSPVLWASRMSATDRASGPAICAQVPCQSFNVNVALPADFWTRSQPGRGGVQFAIQWTSEIDRMTGVGDNLFMYVFRGGQPVITAEGIHSRAYSTTLRSAENGLYTVYVAVDPESRSIEIPFDGQVDVEFEPANNPVRRLLPDLVVRPQSVITFATPIPTFFEPEPIAGQSCTPNEINEDGARKCLRFDQSVANIGEGPLDLRFTVPKSGGPGPVNQVIYYSNDGDKRTETRFVDNWVLHDNHHLHYHYKGLTQSKIWGRDSKGRKVGTEPLRTGRKLSFCIADVAMDRFGQKGEADRTFNVPNCLFPAYSDANNDYLIQGTSRGWVDVYEWFLPGQYIEVSGLSNGTYIFETTVDPDNTLYEASDANNCTSVVIELKDMSKQQPTVRIVGPGPAC